MKVSIITMHAINNYGSVFQALATEQLFQQLGCEVETIDYIEIIKGFLVKNQIYRSKQIEKN